MRWSACNHLTVRVKMHAAPAEGPAPTEPDDLRLFVPVENRKTVDTHYFQSRNHSCGIFARRGQFPLFSGLLIGQSRWRLGGTDPQILGVEPMRLRTRRASWFVLGLLVVTVTSGGLELVFAQPRRETATPAFESETSFELLGEHIFVNVRNVTYTSEEEDFFDIYFASSSSRGTSPLRLRDRKDIIRAKSYFNDEKHYGKRFLKINKYCINLLHIAFVEFKNNALTINFNARTADAFVQLSLSGADAEDFRRKLGGS